MNVWMWMCEFANDMNMWMIWICENENVNNVNNVKIMIVIDVKKWMYKRFISPPAH